MKFAQLFVLSENSRTVQGLAASNPKQLRKELVLHNQQHHILRRIPSKTELAECIDEARELRPRLLAKMPPTDDFEAQLIETLAREKTASRRLDRFYVMVVLLIPALLLLLGAVAAYIQVSSIPFGDDALARA